MLFMIAADPPEALPVSFDALYHRYAAQMFRVAMGILDSREDAEDAVQDALLRLFRYLHHVPPDTDPGQRAYVLTVARHCAISHRKKNKKSRLLVDISCLADSAADPSQLLLQKEDYRLAMEQIRQLPLTCREVFLLHYVYHTPIRATAYLLSMKESAVKQVITRGRRKLREIYTQEVATYEK